MDDTVDELYSAIKFYLTQISREALSEREGRRWTDIVSFTINMEQIGDMHRARAEDIEDKKIRKNRSFSDAGMAEICHLHERLLSNLRLGMSVFLDGHVRDAQKLLEEKARFRDLEHEYAANHIARLQDNTAQSIETSSLHLDLISELKRINSHICSIAYPILESAGALAATRLRHSQLAGLDEGPLNADHRRHRTLFNRRGGEQYSGEPVTQLEHALQTAALAEAEGADDELVTACLLHDLGHLLQDLGDTPTLRGVDDVHQYAALPFLRGLFGDRVLGGIRLHVDAKRYLCATRPTYHDSAVGRFEAQPGAAGRRLHAEQAAAFIAQPALPTRCAAPVGRPGQDRRCRHAAPGALPARARAPLACQPPDDLALTWPVVLAVLCGAPCTPAGTRWSSPPATRPWTRRWCTSWARGRAAVALWAGLPRPRRCPTSPRRWSSTSATTSRWPAPTSTASWG
jgi:predicted HD phosphohydrolase